MNKKNKGKPEIYPSDVKIAVSREYLSTDAGYGELGVKYGYSTDTIRHFLRWYKAHHPDLTAADQTVSPPIDAAQQKAETKQLAEANLKIAALEMLIQNAGKKLGVDLVKKHGTKQSGK